MTGGFDEATATAGREQSFRRPARSARAAVDAYGSHGGTRLALGAAVAAGILIAAQLVHAVAIAPYFPPGPGPWPAWIALAVVLAAGVTTVAALSYRVPDWLFGLILVALAVPVVLDVATTATLLHVGVTATAAPAAAMVLMPVAALRGTAGPLAATSVLAGALAVEALLQLPSAGRSVVFGLAVAGTALLPVALTVMTVRGFRRLARREVDLSLVQSTVATPRTAVGMRASEELAQLDFDAESLLEDVGAGRVAIPLPPDKAELAGRLAARLRIRLIEGRTDTWLRHAVAESAYLSGRVEVTDPNGLAGKLTPAQREGLLFALWLIVGERSRRASARATVRVGQIDAQAGLPAGFADAGGARGDDPYGDLGIAIGISGVALRQLDAAMWDAVESVGTHRTTTDAERLRVDILCRTDQPSRASIMTRERGARTRET
ncbi:hypothetical protein [Agromyces aerolatus]|uniref:hypothetical protein n=1 Tax=Agromyces sp. LY-1074 TaxID=3074080 RepID=UPI0028612934|nr:MULTISPECIES: hypothetical protein [unclassified Agromyces]MDR5699809.1 hypothetical protein [Agromyces sp. LY-1074]MDR5706379.1 hypothetical protein [Agromyces sp. LY-1358]